MDQIQRYKGKCESIIIDDIQFHSIKECCEYHNVPYHTYQIRVYRGMDKIQAATMPLKGHFSMNIKPVMRVEDHEGRKFKNNEDMCNYYGIKKSTYLARRRRGWDIKKALTYRTPQQNLPGFVKDAKGKEYSSKTEMAKAHGLTRHTIDHRVKSGNNLATTLSIPRKHSSGEALIIQILDDLAVKYKTDKSAKTFFKNAYGLNDVKRMRFDFFVQINNNTSIIEYDGKQHFMNIVFANTKRNCEFEEIQKRDKLKNRFCEENNIPLLRIRYDQNDSIYELIKDFIENQHHYTGTTHNKFLSPDVYYNIPRCRLNQNLRKV